MRSPGRAHPQHIPMVPAGPRRAGRDREGGSVPTRPAKCHGGGSPLRLLPLSPGPHNAHALPPYTLLDPPRGTDWGARQSAGSTSATVRHPPHGKGDAVSRVWAFSPPGTTDWAAFGRQVSGAWSVARSPPPYRTALLPEVSVRGPRHTLPRRLSHRDRT